MDRYYYTVSALPSLTFDGEPGMDAESFLQLCDETLEPADMTILRGVRLRSDGEPTGNAAADGWSRWERSLRAETAKARASRRGLEPESAAPRMGPESAAVLEAARAAMSEASPDAAEDILLRAMWGRMDELETGHHFDLDKLVVYYLRVQLLELKARRNKADGEKNFSLIHDAILADQPN